ncbi:MAG: hypothetical protein Ct9H300mP1_11350 [Planctomycetaceae bacterium]|nr:MAG: hypothetical protein Ct9H300mP1_11350 [Planctomycetaceae bacterium]
MFDFGTRTVRPDHLELLDHLVTEFITGGWSMKKLHRVITTSRAYQRESRIDTSDPAETRDPDNRLFRRVPVRRMEGEVMRDSLLALSGKLDTTIGERSFRAPRPPPACGGRSTTVTPVTTSSRCSNRSTRPVSRNATRGHETIAPQQSLALANSRMVQDLSASIGRRLSKQVPPGFVDAAYETILGRAPSATNGR